MDRSGWTQASHVAAALLLVGGLVVGLAVDGHAAAKQILKLGTILPTDNILTENAQEFAKKVN